jgi:hypothetical protein
MCSCVTATGNARARADVYAASAEQFAVGDTFSSGRSSELGGECRDDAVDSVKHVTSICADDEDEGPHKCVVLQCSCMWNLHTTAFVNDSGSSRFLLLFCFFGFSWSDVIAEPWSRVLAGEAAHITATVQMRFALIGLLSSRCHVNVASATHH